MILCAGEIETFPFATPIGIGLCDATIHLTRLVLMRSPEFLLFVGSAGSYGHYQPLEIVESKTASQIELSYLLQKSYTPLSANLITSDPNVSRETPITRLGQDQQPTIVNSSNYITTDITLAKRFNRLGIGLENMEFFAVMRVAQTFQIPCGGIFIVTNYCDHAAHTMFEKHHANAMQKLHHYLAQRIEHLETFNT